ncbi:MAG: 50S ribosomal protein L21 [Deltaproteobacteria bacterium]|nr:50S ribosomal protein L21 [Deltaproteobacteria bacterium]
MYAVIKTGGKQQKVSEGQIVTVEKLAGEKGDTVTFDEVLLVANDDDIRVGTPYVEGAKVTGEIVEQTKGEKIFVFRMKRRKGYHKKTGHRQLQTNLKIKEISI